MKALAAALLLLGPAAALAGTSSSAAHFAPFRGFKVHYESYGEDRGADPSDPVLVFIHGWTCDLTFWRGQEPVYAMHRSLLIDLPGHGLSDKPRIPYPMEFFARAVEAVMRDAHVEHAVLIGHSLGGPIIYAFMRLFPQKASAIVFVDVDVRPGSAGPMDHHEQRLRMAGRAQAMRSPAGDRAFAANVESCFTPRTPEAVKEDVRQKMLGTPKFVRIASVTSPSSLPPPGKDEAFDLPAIAIQATSSGTDVRYGIMQKLFPALQLEKWDGSGHFLMMEDPERFNQSLERFLAALPSR